MNPVKRFIAGAVCPRCGQMDCLRTWRDETQIYRECVRCDFNDAQLAAGDNPPPELETRVSRAEEAAADPDAQPLLFHPNPDNTRHDH
ncbi:YheV family putative zinc ribbon protein [Pontibacter sp. JAM-7]|uniref:YheV family putative zinc ribbon protein n=1 Tax=Pontibacter sp. JAM-7 TaxID=3366581 RepID=UPI003AF64776